MAVLLDKVSITCSECEFDPEFLEASKQQSGGLLLCKHLRIRGNVEIVGDAAVSYGNSDG